MMRVLQLGRREFLVTAILEGEGNEGAFRLLTTRSQNLVGLTRPRV